MMTMQLLRGPPRGDRGTRKLPWSTTAFSGWVWRKPCQMQGNVTNRRQYTSLFMIISHLSVLKNTAWGERVPRHRRSASSTWCVKGGIANLSYMQACYQFNTFYSVLMQAEVEINDRLLHTVMQWRSALARPLTVVKSRHARTLINMEPS